MSVHKKILEKHGYQEQDHQQQQQSEQDKVKIRLSKLVNSQYIRPTSQVFPMSKSTYFDAKMPFAIVVQPFGPSIEEGFPWVDFGNNPILRCENCRGYLNPYMTFHQQGEDIRCNLCLMQMRIPSFFYQPLNEENNFQRSDIERADLSQGSYDIRAGQDYSNRPPMAPTYFFMIDVSYKTQGILSILSSVLKEAINKYNERTQIGFITFDKQIQLYNFDSKLKSAQMVVITDMTTQELPIPGELVFNVFESKDQIFGFLDNLDIMFQNRPQPEATQFCNALVISQKIIQFVGGKLIIINGSQIEQLQLKAQQQKQNILAYPSNPIFSQLTPEMHFQNICPSIFIFPNGYMNVITINDLARHLNGDLFYYDDINNAHKNFFYDLKDVLEREYAWEAVFRIRPSIGWRIRQTYGNYSIKNNDLLNLTICDQSKSLTYELELLNSTARTDFLYLQSATLYTSKSGQRRIRVHNYALPLSDDINLIYQMADVPTISAVILKLALYKLYKTLSPIDTSRFIYISIKVLYEMGLEKQDENIIQIAQYGIGLMKNSLFNSTYGQSINTDIINQKRLLFNFMSVDELTSHYLPALFKIDDIQADECILDNNGYFIFPQQVTLSLESVQSGLFLMDCGDLIIIYISKQHDQQLCSDIFGNYYMQQPLQEDNLYFKSENPINNKLHSLIQELRMKKESKNYFNDDEDIDLESDDLFGKDALNTVSQPFEEYFEKFNLLYNKHMEKFQAFENDYQIPLTNPDYESLIQSHFMIYEKNLGLFDFVRSENKTFDKICASFVYVDNQIKQIEEQFYKFLDKLTIYGELSDLHQNEETKLNEGESEIMIARMLGMFKNIYDIIKKIINYVTFNINTLNLLYNKKDPISKSFKTFNLNFPLDTIGRALTMIYVLDQVVEQNDYLQQHWNFYKRMIKIVKGDINKYNTNQQNLKSLEKILIRLDKTVLSGTCLNGVLQLKWDQGINDVNGKEKSPNIPAIKNNKDFFALLNQYLKERIDLFEKKVGTAQELFERDLIMPTLCVYAILRRLYSDEDRNLWKNLWTIQKRLPMVEGHSQVLCYISKFLMEVTPLAKKSSTMDPKDPIQNFKLYLAKLSQTFPQSINALYQQFTAWIVRMDSYATSQAAFNGIEKVTKEKAKELIEERMAVRVTLAMSGIQIGSQIRNLLQSLLLGHYGLEEQTLDKSLIKDVVLAVQMLKAIEYYYELKFDSFQPALIQHQIAKNGLAQLTTVIGKVKTSPKNYGAGANELIGALQIVISMLKSTLTPIKLETLHFCTDFVYQIFNPQEKEDFKYILNRLDKSILLPYYVRKVTASTYFYWCRDLLPQFFQSIYQEPSIAKRFQFLLNAVSDCSQQLKGCQHLDEPDELYDSFRKYVVQEFYIEYLQPLARDIEDYLRIQVHTVLIQKITALNPFKQQVKDLKRLLDVDQVLIFDSIVNLRQEINQQLNETFYNINVLNMYDQETYEQMRTIANYKFGLHLMNVYLPSQTVDQGSFDVLDIIKNIPAFLTKYTYNLFQQQFVQITSESKQVYSISIKQISDSIRTHGPGILNTNVNSVYNYIKKKIQVFSQFLFDDYIQSPLMREEKFFKDKKDELEGCYPFERAEALYKEIKKMGTFDDGSNYMDKFRTLITHIGNALAFVRLLRSAALHFASKGLEFCPNKEQQPFEIPCQESGFSDTTIKIAKELDEIFVQLKNSFSENTDYIHMLVKVFESIRSPENKHLNRFHLIVPALTINYIEKMIMAKEQMGKRSQNDCFISDDGFVIGIQYFLSLLDLKSKFDALHWRKEIRQRYQKDKQAATNLQQRSNQQSQRAADEINLQKELSLKKITSQYEEYQMFFYGFNACKILFIDK